MKLRVQFSYAIISFYEIQFKVPHLSEEAFYDQRWSNELNCILFKFLFKYKQNKYKIIIKKIVPHPWSTLHVYICQAHLSNAKRMPAHRCVRKTNMFLMKISLLQLNFLVSPFLAAKSFVRLQFLPCICFALFAG